MGKVWPVSRVCVCASMYVTLKARRETDVELVPERCSKKLCIKMASPASASNSIALPLGT